MKKRTIEELFNSGDLKKGQFFYKDYKRRRCVKILFFKFWLRSKSYEIYEFRGKTEDGYYRFEMLYGIHDCYYPIVTKSGVSYCGGKSEMDFKRLYGIRVK